MYRNNKIFLIFCSKLKCFLFTFRGNYSSSCIEGFTGPLCQSCLKTNLTFYTKPYGENICTPCPSKTNLLIVLVTLLVFFSFLTFLLVHYNINVKSSSSPYRPSINPRQTLYPPPSSLLLSPPSSFLPHLPSLIRSSSFLPPPEFSIISPSPTFLPPPSSTSPLHLSPNSDLSRNAPLHHPSTLTFSSSLHPLPTSRDPPQPLYSSAPPEKEMIDSIKSIHIKIMMNFLQLLSIIALLNLNWSPTMNNILVAQSSMSGWFLKFISFDCLQIG